MAHLAASKARQGFADTINRAGYGKERVVVRWRGKEIAAVVPIDDLRLLEELEDRIDLTDAWAALAETKKKGAKPLDVILKDFGFWVSMAYSILLAPPAERQLTASAQATQKRIITRLKTLQCNPCPQGITKLAGEGNLYPIRDGIYRVIYTIQDKN